MAKSNKSKLLPQEYYTKHDLLLYYIDLIVNLLELADKDNLSSVTININDEEMKITKEGVLDWLIDNGYQDEAIKATKPHIFFSLLTDFVFYMRESVSCSERGKVTVAYTLSRKPIKDNLFYFCWLLVDQEDFINCMMNEEPIKYDVTKINVDKKKEIINKASELVDMSFKEDFLFNMIYKRDALYGLSSIWDQSLHLVTGNKSYPTEQGNLNFIFPTDKIWNQYWKAYYEKFPLIMKFSIEVIILIFESILKPNDSIVSLNKTLRQSKVLKTYSKSYNTDSLLHLLEYITVECEACRKEYELSGEVGEEFVNDNIFTCPHCGLEKLVGEYLLVSNRTS